ncbi:hypothetical protein ACFSTI_06760 [Rhizorhabdus histidinilytica]
MRKPPLTVEQFNGRWLGEHGPGSRKVPGLRGFVLGEVVADPGSRPDAPAGPALDGITESWQSAGIDRAVQARDNPLVRDWLAAAPTYIGAITIYATREHVFVPPVRGGLKVMTLISRKPGASHEDFVRHVLEVHGPLSRDVPGLGGYVLSEIVRSAGMPGSRPFPGSARSTSSGRAGCPPSRAAGQPIAPDDVRGSPTAPRISVGSCATRWSSMCSSRRLTLPHPRPRAERAKRGADQAAWGACRADGWAISSGVTPIAAHSASCTSRGCPA